MPTSENKTKNRRPTGLLTTNPQETRRILAEKYQAAYIAEQQQRKVTNDSIQALRAAEKALKIAACNFSDWDRMNIKI